VPQDIVLTEKERKLIEALRAIPYGQVTIFLKNTQPIRIVKTEESVEL